ncbi:HAD family hydrolase [Sphingomonas sp. UV9]|uniref:HAD-IA family hydrolase n=1 Tax=Sphingomonas sp. UV9 TaxID=1851410 RepID=UPI000FFB8286|nr:HAD-IA family hydrolase [Sphingomonas sp. UV9]RXD07216.1 HAD family hydrolase [Sphingomonas sp. UV9]
MTLPTRSYAAFLFDMDGTILTSIASAERTWTAWAIAHGLDVATFLPTIHGVQSVETIRRLGLPGIDPVVEAAGITAAEMEDVGDIEPIAGAAAFLASLPPERWTIVTSAPRALAQVRLKAAGMPVPATMIAADDIPRGKPAPDCFLTAADRLGVAASDCLVFEDAAAGIASGKAAGADVVVITATHGSSHASDDDSYRVKDYRDLAVVVDARGAMTVTRG